MLSITFGITFRRGSTIGFSNIPADNITNILFRNTAPGDSASNYCAGENYYYLVTNFDDANALNDAEVFARDATVHPNGRYRVEVSVWDPSNIMTTISKQVRINN